MNLTLHLRHVNISKACLIDQELTPSTILLCVCCTSLQLISSQLQINCEIQICSCNWFGCVGKFTIVIQLVIHKPKIVSTTEFSLNHASLGFAEVLVLKNNTFDIHLLLTSSEEHGSSCYSTISCKKNLHLGIQLNASLTLATYLKHFCRAYPHHHLHPPPYVATPLPNTEGSHVEQLWFQQKLL